jgi:hypothetical protein
MHSAALVACALALVSSSIARPLSERQQEYNANAAEYQPDAYNTEAYGSNQYAPTATQNSWSSSSPPAYRYNEYVAPAYSADSWPSTPSPSPTYVPAPSGSSNYGYNQYTAASGFATINNYHARPTYSGSAYDRANSTHVYTAPAQPSGSYYNAHSYDAESSGAHDPSVAALATHTLSSEDAAHVSPSSEAGAAY